MVEDRHIEAAIEAAGLDKPGFNWTAGYARSLANDRALPDIQALARSILAHAETLARVEEIAEFCAEASEMRDIITSAGGDVHPIIERLAGFSAALKPKDK